VSAVQALGDGRAYCLASLSGCWPLGTWLRIASMSMGLPAVWRLLLPWLGSRAMSAAVTTGGPAADGSSRSSVITLSTRLYGLRMNPRSAHCGQNHETRRSEAQPLWITGRGLQCLHARLAWV
jgi:hypothetical protein